jgi:hypothetical protein
MSRIDIKEFYSKYLEDLKNKVSGVMNTTSSYVGAYSSNNFYCYFYEWSDMSKPGKKFNTRDELFKFFRDSKITFTEEDVKYIQSKNLIYGICVKNNGKLLLADKYMDIRDKFNKESFENISENSSEI